MLAEPINQPDRKLRSISLVPNSGIQFLDFGFSLDRLGQAPLFRAKAEGNHTRLLELEPDPSGLSYIDSEGEQIFDHSEELVRTNKERLFETFEKAWLPMPMMKIQSISGAGVKSFDQGPLNWVRMRVVKLDKPDPEGFTHHLVVAVDTSLLPRYDRRPYAAPAPEDIPVNSEFALAYRQGEIAWMQETEWSRSIVEQSYDEYLFSHFNERQYHARKARTTSFEIWAQYCALVRLLGESDEIPYFRFIDNVSKSGLDEVIKVDLALDMGNSRTCGILVESSGFDAVDFNSCYSLELRDLSRAEHIYRDPFPSRIEFHEEAFGNNRLTRRSRADAFTWPTPARIGWEASHLSYFSSNAEGITGLSSPKRYLWDTREQIHEWQYNRFRANLGDKRDTQGHEPAIKGALFRFLTNSGDEWRKDDPQSICATRARYSRSSMMLFYLAEVFAQAITHINSFALRKKRPYTDVPRRLNRIILTMPTAMTIPERRQFDKWANLSLKILVDGFKLKPEHSPELVLQWDEATGTQSVFLYNEIKANYRGDMDLFYEAHQPLNDVSTQTKPPEDRVLRIASLDIGGGTTDLIINNYRFLEGSALKPEHELREGFNIAGDDILSALIEEHVIPAIHAHLVACGTRNAVDVLVSLLGATRANDDVRRATLQRQFTLQVAMPCALRMIELYEQFEPKRGNQVVTLHVRDLLSGDKQPHQEVIDFLADAARAQGAQDFDLMDLRIEVNMLAVDATVTQTIGPVLADMCELVYLSNCDYLLISGRPCMMPAVRNAVIAKMPVPVDRIIPMNQYKVGTWYPFRNNLGYLADPKTTAAVGAMVCALSEGHLERFTLLSRNIHLRSTINFLGMMEDTGHIKNSNLYFNQLDLDGELSKKSADLSSQFKFSGPMFVGFRQLGVERWPATPLFRLDFKDPDRARFLALPLTITLGLIPRDEDRTFKVFDVQDIVDAEGNSRPVSEVQFSLQTLPDRNGHWKDTGVFKVPMHLK